MGLISGLVKAGVAKKVYDEARKPHNQQKAKELFAKVRGQEPGDGGQPPARGQGPGDGGGQPPAGSGAPQQPR